MCDTSSKSDRNTKGFTVIHGSAPSAGAPLSAAERERRAARGVVRYDSDTHTEADILALPPAWQARVRRAQACSLGGRIVLKQTAPMPDDDPVIRAAVLAAMSGIRVVEDDA